MRTMSRTLAWCAVVVLATGVGVFAQAPAGGGTPHAMRPGQGQGQGTGRGMGQMHGAGPMAGLAALNLSDQQKQDIHKLMMDAQPQMQASMEQMDALHDRLKAEVFADNGPTGNTSAIAQEANALQAKMIQTHIALAEKFSAILTPEQRKQVRDMPMDALMGMMGMGMMHGRGGAPPPKK